MPNRAALVIAVETFFEAGPSIPYATADCAEIVRSLPPIGYDPAKCYLLTGTRTTKTAIQSHLNRLSKLIASADSVLVLIVTRGFSHRGHGYLVCADTISPDLLSTSLPLAELYAALKKSRCREAIVLLDVDPLPSSDQSVSGGLDPSELSTVTESLPSCVTLLANQPGQRSYESVELRHGIWRHHLIEIFTGKVRSSVTTDGRLTAKQLQSYLEDAVPRTLRRVQNPEAEQTPVLIGGTNTAIIIGELGQLFGEGSELLDPSRMSRVVFRSERTGKVKDLAGFRKSHSLPDRANDWARKFVNRVAAADIKADLDCMFEMIRDQFGYKRKDLDVCGERDGCGFIRTPDFEYSISVRVNPEEPTEVIWRRELGRLSGPEFVQSSGFQAVYGTLFDQLVFEFRQPVNVAEFVDRLEEAPVEGMKVQVASDANAAAITLTGFHGKVHLTPDSLTIEGRAGNPASLLKQFLIFLNKFAGLGEPKSLPPARE